jgi:glycine cleavage system H lipoate-binding protein
MTDKEFKEKLTQKKRIVGFQILEDECIWMKAGVVNFRLCDNAYDCYNCPFDKGMQRTIGAGNKVASKKKEPGWVEHLKARYQGAERTCRYALTGRVDAPKICPMNYECYHCAYDQMMDDLDFAQLSNAPKYTLAAGYKMAEGYYYHMGHSWVRFDHGGRVRVGFDDFMMKLFGNLKSIELPPLGTTLKKDEVGITIGRDKHKAASLSPATGTVLAINQKVRERPEIAQEDPFNEGWLYILEPDMPKRNLKGLYYGKESIQWMEQEGQRLLDLMGPEYEKLAATGGRPISDVFGSFPEIGWNRLVKTFLGTEKV